MLDKDCAIEVKAHSMKAISELTWALHVCRTQYSAEELEEVKYGVGLSIGSVHDELLWPIFSAYPELNHLRDLNSETPEA